MQFVSIFLFYDDKKAMAFWDNFPIITRDVKRMICKASTSGKIVSCRAATAVALNLNMNKTDLLLY